MGFFFEKQFCFKFPTHNKFFPVFLIKLLVIIGLVWFNWCVLKNNQFLLSKNVFKRAGCWNLHFLSKVRYSSHRRWIRLCCYCILLLWLKFFLTKITAFWNRRFCRKFLCLSCSLNMDLIFFLFLFRNFKRLIDWINSKDHFLTIL